MSMIDKTVIASEQSVLATNKVLRNTYTLLSMTLLFSALCAGIAVMTNMPPLGMIVTLVGYFGLPASAIAAWVCCSCSHSPASWG
jgi:modulator of FtsH protease